KESLSRCPGNGPPSSRSFPSTTARPSVQARARRFVARPPAGSCIPGRRPWDPRRIAPANLTTLLAVGCNARNLVSRRGWRVDMHRFRVLIVLVSLAVLAAISCAPPALAQGVDTALLRGTVTDASGAVIPNVMVTMTNVATGISEKRPTDSAG